MPSHEANPTLTIRGCEPKRAAHQLVVVSRDAGDAPALASPPGGQALAEIASAGCCMNITARREEI